VDSIVNSDEIKDDDEVETNSEVCGLDICKQKNVETQINTSMKLLPEWSDKTDVADISKLAQIDK
jgi:hypothetical protein